MMRTELRLTVVPTCEDEVGDVEELAADESWLLVDVVYTATSVARELVVED